MNWHEHYGSLSIRLPRYLTSMLPQPSDSGVFPFTGPRNNGQLLLDKQASTLPPRTPALNPSSSFNGLYSTRYSILFVGIKDWKTVQNQAWLGLFIQSCPFTQSVAESPCEQHPWSSHPLKDVLPLGRYPPPHLRFISLPGFFWTLFKTHKKQIAAQVSLGLRDLKLSQNEPNTLYHTFVLNSCWQPLNSSHCSAWKLAKKTQKNIHFSPCPPTPNSARLKSLAKQSTRWGKSFSMWAAKFLEPIPWKLD